jgi:thiol-disulfide isomerase/thioredoxin|tara:strand:+ start:141 stop:824 length:684 start_codon:yes stop_codon:yes gene_type:complete
MMKLSKTFQAWVISLSFLGILLCYSCASDTLDALDESTSTQGQETLVTPYNDPDFYQYVRATIGGHTLPYSDDIMISDNAIGMKVPYIEGTLLDGEREIIFDDSDTSLNQTTIVIVLAHWCPHCRNEVRELSKYFNETEIPKNVRITSLATSIDDSRTNYPPHDWFEEEDWPIPVIIDTIESDIADSLGVNIFPFFVVIDENGIVRLRLAGRMGTDGMGRLISDLSK